MIDNLTLILESIMSTLDQIIVLYFSGSIISIFFAIWIIRKVSKLLQHLR